MLNTKGSVGNLERLFFALRGFHLFLTESVKKDENRLEMSPNFTNNKQLTNVEVTSFTKV